MHHIIVKKDNLKRKKYLKKFLGILKVFDNAGIEYAVHETVNKNDPREIARDITCGKGNSVIVAGGDGTLHEVLNGFIDFENNFMGIIPFGTGNDFAESAGIPLNPVKAAELIIKNTPRPVDFIELSSGLRSLNAVGMGIDVDVLKRAYSGRNTKKSKYFRALLVSLAKYESVEFTMSSSGKESLHYGLIAAVGNGKQIGGGIKVFPEAKIDDGYLDVLVADYISRFQTIGALIKLMRGKVNKVKQVTALKVKSVKLCAKAENYTIQADGELYNNVPIEAKISDSKLMLYT